MALAVDFVLTSGAGLPRDHSTPRNIATCYQFAQKVALLTSLSSLPGGPTPPMSTYLQFMIIGDAPLPLRAHEWQLPAVRDANSTRLSPTDIETAHKQPVSSYPRPHRASPSPQVSTFCRLVVMSGAVRTFRAHPWLSFTTQRAPRTTHRVPLATHRASPALVPYNVPLTVRPSPRTTHPLTLAAHPPPSQRTPPLAAHPSPLAAHPSPSQRTARPRSAPSAPRRTLPSTNCPPLDRAEIPRSGRRQHWKRM